ncbi:NADPH-dependent FMN reductase [Aquihabitans daechungensis]|uniref:NADPH-dependent FMN reductase n=1 Tax=Aquihabitans daechungensis TaxID=1052257 RepID=UPI003BA26258
MSGSLQARSSTAAVLASIADLVTLRAAAEAPVGAACATAPTFEVFDGIEELPHFNPDRDVEPPPAEVAAWRSTLAAADAVVIATPEYAHGYPGALKDALDWIVGSGELVDTPVLLVTASGSGGVRAGAALTPVLEVMSARLVGPISIWGVSPKVTEGRLTDPDDLDALSAAIELLLAHAAEIPSEA